MPLRPKMIGFRFSTRLDVLGPADVVEMICPQCARRHMLAPWQLLGRFEPTIHLDIVGERFHCKNCGWRGQRKKGARWAIYTAHPPLSEVPGS